MAVFLPASRASRGATGRDRDQCQIDPVDFDSPRLMRHAGHGAFPGERGTCRLKFNFNESRAGRLESLQCSSNLAPSYPARNV